MAHVNPYLMRATCFESQLKERKRVRGTKGVRSDGKNLIMGDGVFSSFGHAEAAVLVAKACYGLIDSALGAYGLTLTDGEVRSLEVKRVQLLLQKILHMSMLCEDDQSGGVLIKTINGVGNAVCPGVLIVGCYVITKCAAKVTPTGVNDKARWLVQNEKVIVFVDYLHRSRLGLNRCLPSIVKKGKRDNLAAARNCVGAAWRVVKKDSLIDFPGVTNDGLAYVHPISEDEVNGIAIVFGEHCVADRSHGGNYSEETELFFTFFCYKLLTWGFAKFNPAI